MIFFSFVKSVKSAQLIFSSTYKHIDHDGKKILFSLSLSLSLPVSFSLSLSVCLCLSVCVCLPSLFLFLCLSVSVYLSLSFTNAYILSFFQLNFPSVPAHLSYICAYFNIVSCFHASHSHVFPPFLCFLGHRFVCLLLSVLNPPPPPPTHLP